MKLFIYYAYCVINVLSITHHVNVGYICRYVKNMNRFWSVNPLILYFDPNHRAAS
jgi:hypothetical protein